MGPIFVLLTFSNNQTLSTNAKSTITLMSGLNSALDQPESRATTRLRPHRPLIAARIKIPAKRSSRVVGFRTQSKELAWPVRSLLGFAVIEVHGTSVCF